MPAFATAVFALVVVAFVSQSRRLEGLHLTAPIVFTLVGAALGGVVFDEPVSPHVVRSVTEVTLALVLFHDAAQVQPRQLRSDAGMCLRLLLIGLPLTIALGFGTAWLLQPGMGPWLALLVGASLAPTDAGLGAATVLNPKVPVRVRRLLNVESGLNDGLATPVVLVAIAAAGAASADQGSAALTMLWELLLGLVIGVVLGAGCGRLLSWARRHGLIEHGLLPVAALAVPLLTYFGSVAAGGNGFVAAFVSGTAYAAGSTRWQAHSAAPPTEEADDLQLAERVSVILGYAVWALFGAIAVAHLPTVFAWQELIFAALSLTVLRMVPVAIALLGSGLRRPTRLFIGWFGPRGLASVVFALLAVESVPASPDLQRVVGTVATTVFLSVILHGVTADPWAARFGQWAARERPPVELAGTVEPAAVRGARRASAPVSDERLR